MLACRRVGWRSRQASVGGKAWVGKQAGSIQKQSSAPPTKLTCRRTRSTTAGAGLPVEQHRSLARSSIDTLGKGKHACCWARSSALQGSARAEKLRTPTNNVMSRRAGLSTKAAPTTTTPLSNPSTWQDGLRSAKWRAPRLSGKGKGGGDVAAGGSKRRLSFLSGGGGAGDTALVYGLVALNVAGTLVWVLDAGGNLENLLVNHLMVSTHATLGQLKLHTLFTSNFSHSNLWNGALCSYMVYNFGPSAIQILGRSQFLALYILGGALSQLCQVAGPIIATKLGLPTVLQVDPFYYSCGGSGSLLAVLAWYCISFPTSQVVLVVVPVQTGIAGALFLGATLFQVVTNGEGGVPFIGGPTREIWRTLGAAAAGCFVAFASRGRGVGVTISLRDIDDNDALPSYRGLGLSVVVVACFGSVWGGLYTVSAALQAGLPPFALGASNVCLVGANPTCSVPAL